VFAKAKRGEKVVVDVIGGSITEGALASAPDKRWASLVAQWWRDTFPKAKIEFINAGIGATGSDIGAHRAFRHLLKFNISLGSNPRRLRRGCFIQPCSYFCP